MTGGSGRSEEWRRFATFVVTGTVAASVTLVARFLLSTLMVFEAAVALAQILGTTIAFVLARQFVFGGTARGLGAEYARFALVNVVSFVQVWVVSVGLLRLALPRLGFTWHAEEITHFIGLASLVVTSYYGHKHFSFAGVQRDGPSRAVD